MQVLGRMGNRATHKLRRLLLRNNPCMDQQQLAASINASRITSSGAVKVITGCCSRQAAGKAKLCKTRLKGL
jgi:hypothetical protein